VGGEVERDCDILQETLRALAGHFLHGVEEQDLAAPRGRFAATADQHTGFHGRIVEQVRPQAQYALDQVVLDQPGAHGLFFIAEEHAMREQDRTAPAFGVQARKNMLEEGIIGAALRRRAVQVAPVGVLLPGFAVPLLDRKLFSARIIESLVTSPIGRISASTTGNWL
jgi:hypothetical protein